MLTINNKEIVGSNWFIGQLSKYVVRHLENVQCEGDDQWNTFVF